MNNIAISPYIGMYALQIQNVKRNTSKTANIDVLNKTPVEENQNITTEITDTNSDTEKNEETVENEIKLQNKTI
jgi:tRNA (Thr-GGU) A37 N-methylase